MKYNFRHFLYTKPRVITRPALPWASCQIRQIMGCACAGNAGNVFPPSRVSDPDMHHGTCCMPRSLTSGFLRSWWQGKRSRHYRRMYNPQIYVPGKRPVAVGIAGCYNDNLRCHQWRHSRHCGSSRFSVFVYPSKCFYVSNQIICKISLHSVPSTSPYLAGCFLQITQKRRPIARLLYSSF